MYILYSNSQFTIYEQISHKKEEISYEQKTYLINFVCGIYRHPA